VKKRQNVSELALHCLGRKKINFSTVFAGQAASRKSKTISGSSALWVYLGYFDLETWVLEPLDDPFGPKLLPM
jgi:putative transposase